MSKLQRLQAFADRFAQRDAAWHTALMAGYGGEGVDYFDACAAFTADLKDAIAALQQRGEPAP